MFMNHETIPLLIAIQMTASLAVLFPETSLCLWRSIIRKLPFDKVHRAQKKRKLIDEKLKKYYEIDLKNLK